MYGEGHDYHPLYAPMSPQLVGAVPVGFETFENEDQPFYPMQNNATYKEVWATHNLPHDVVDRHAVTAGTNLGDGKGRWTVLPWDVAWLLCLLKLFFRCSMIKVSVPRKRPLFWFILHIDNFLHNPVC